MLTKLVNQIGTAPTKPSEKSLIAILTFCQLELGVISIATTISFMVTKQEDAQIWFQLNYT